ncbi:hypothetical protein V8G54_016151 [Vigna mungo]|uniref:Uncharacterized protein n=1 Tax=Vigna mungo TaxID=3915 RepID=A0AAQ3NKM0_VIGMU
MKQRKEESEGHVYESMAEVVPRSSVPPPPPPPLPKFSKLKPEESVTNREIARFWRQKRIEEEDHLLAAIKAAARLRARNLTRQMWTKSKYAYLNQPAIDSMDLPKKRSSTYVPNFLSYQPKPLYASAIGVF